MKQLNLNLMIEYFPHIVGCAKMCPHCPIAGKMDPDAKPDKDSIKTLKFIQKYIEENYVLALGGGIEIPIPRMKKPQLVKELAVQVRIDYDKKSVEEFSEKLKLYLVRNKISPKHLSLAIFPKSHILSNEDRKFTKMLIETISPWFFKTGDYLLISFNKNQIKRDIFTRDINKLKEVSLKISFKGMGRSRYRTLRDKSETEGNLQSVNKCVNLKTKDGKNIQINERIVSFVQKENLKEEYIERGISTHYDLIENNRWSFMIHSKGVMIMHSSIDINNPILWISHKSFRYLIENLSTQQYKLKTIIASILLFNVVEYRYNFEELNFNFETYQKYIDKKIKQNLDFLKNICEN